VALETASVFTSKKFIVWRKKPERKIKKIVRGAISFRGFMEYLMPV